MAGKEEKELVGKANQKRTPSTLLYTAHFGPNLPLICIASQMLQCHSQRKPEMRWIPVYSEQEEDENNREGSENGADEKNSANIIFSKIILPM